MSTGRHDDEQANRRLDNARASSTLPDVVRPADAGERATERQIASHRETERQIAEHLRMVGDEFDRSYSMPNLLVSSSY